MRDYSRVAAGIALVVVASCGGDGGEGGDAAQAAPQEVAGAPMVPICEAVLQGELQSFTGRTFRAGIAKVAEGEMYRCEWEPASDDQGVVTLTVHPDAEAAMKQYEILPAMHDVEGVGDAAWWSNAAQTYVMRLGERLFVVGFGGADGSHQYQAEQILRRAMERV